MPHIERLENLRRVVAAIDPSRLNMNAWKVGEARCAAGHACEDAWHREQGLSFVTDADGDQEPAYDHLRHYEALAAFYGINIDTALYLFHALEYPDDPNHAGPRVRAALASGTRVIETLCGRIDLLLSSGSNHAAH